MFFIEKKVISQTDIKVMKILRQILIKNQLQKLRLQSNVKIISRLNDNLRRKLL